MDPYNEESSSDQDTETDCTSVGSSVSPLSTIWELDSCMSSVDGETDPSSNSFSYEKEQGQLHSLRGPLGICIVAHAEEKAVVSPKKHVSLDSAQNSRETKKFQLKARLRALESRILAVRQAFGKAQ
eukprot:scaffold4809_cov116-Cylindrotheca_fusiformis.AAC.7